MEMRQVSLLVGRKSYNLLTTLDDEALRQVHGFLRDAIAGTDASREQDERLFLAGMTLASQLAAISNRVDALLEEQAPDTKDTPSLS